MPVLPADAREIFEREGWFVARALFGADHLPELVAATERLEQEAATFDRNRLLSGVSFELQTATGRRGEPPVFPGALRKIRFPSKRERAFSDLRSDALLFKALAELGLPTPKCMVDQLNFKLPRVGTGFPFHQDTYFVQGTSKGRIERHGGINLVIALDHADAGNGGLEVLGRTHHSEVEFTYDRASTNEGVFDETHRTLVALAPGDTLFFHPLLAHGSGNNRSDRNRRVVTMWFRGGGPTAQVGGRPHRLGRRDVG
ncbi:MAG: phytanoyl-CoA dioxygenase family protein [Archangium sp.]